MENFVLPRMPVYDIYVGIHVPYIHNTAVHGRFYGLD